MKYSTFRISVSRRDGAKMTPANVEQVIDLLCSFIKLAPPVRGMERQDFVDFNYSGYVSEDFLPAVFENNLWRVNRDLQFSMFTSNLGIVPDFDIFSCHGCSEEMHAKAKESFYGELKSHFEISYAMHTGKYQPSV